jgi:preprotein translocase subunit YajC
LVVVVGFFKGRGGGYFMNANWGTILGMAQPAGAAAPPGGQEVETTATQGAPDNQGAKHPAGPCGGQDPMVTILMMLAMFAAFYFLLIRPQQKKSKDHQNMLGSIKKGDEIVTGGGLVGKVTGISDKLLTVEISEKVRVRVLKSQVVDKFAG